VCATLNINVICAFRKWKYFDGDRFIIYHLLKASSYYEKKTQEMEEEKRVYSSLMAQHG
jgi:hypothetical protein